MTHAFVLFYNNNYENHLNFMTYALLDRAMGSLVPFAVIFAMQSTKPNYQWEFVRPNRNGVKL